MDSQTGHVYFSTEVPFVTYVHWYGDDVGLQFRLDSRLLVLHGSPKEEPAGNPYERGSFVLELTGWFMSQVRGA